MQARLLLRVLALTMTLAWGGAALAADDVGKLRFRNSFSPETGMYPQAGVVLGPDGDLYGTTRGEGNGCGTVFRLKLSTGALKSIHRFSGGANGCHSYAPLLLASDGAFYGLADAAKTAKGTGVLFRITAEGEFTVLHSFVKETGAEFTNGLIQARDGLLYGTAKSGGKHERGTIFKVSLAGEFTLLGELSDKKGRWPSGRLLEGDDGTFYGTAKYGGKYNWGVIFMVTPLGAYTVLYDFLDSRDRLAVPCNGLVYSPERDLMVGTTSSEVYTFDFNARKISFAKRPGDFPGPLLLGPDGKTFYTYAMDAVYSFVLGNGGYNRSRIFERGGLDNHAAQMPVLVDGKLYGALMRTGDYGGGVMFDLSKFVKQ